MPSIITPTKTVNQILIAWQDIGNTNVIFTPTPINLATIYAAAFGIRLGRRSATPFTANWPNIRIEFSEKASGNDGWIPGYVFQPMLGVNIANTTLSSAVSANAATFTVALATNIAVGDQLFLGDGSPANYEIVRVKGLSGTTVTPEEPVTFNHQSGAIVTDQAEMQFPLADVVAYSRVRAVVDNASSGVSISAQVTMTTLDNHSISP